MTSPFTPASLEIRQHRLDGRHLDVEGLADCSNRREVEAVYIEGYAFHLDHYPPRAICRQLLPPAAGTEAVQDFGPGELVCSVHAAEIMDRAHPDYFPLPPGITRSCRRRAASISCFTGSLAMIPIPLRCVRPFQKPVLYLA